MCGGAKITPPKYLDMSPILHDPKKTIRDGVALRHNTFKTFTVRANGYVGRDIPVA